MNIWEHWQRQRWLHRAAASIERARRLGHGVQLHEWEHQFATRPAHEIEPLIEAIVDWCRHTLAGCRRPWGIDYFDLAFACSLGAPRPGPTRSISFRRLRPADLYGLGRLRAEIAQLLSELCDDAGSDAAGPCRVAVALFSWGNAAHAALS